MVDDAALGIHAAQARTRVHALQALAGAVRRTVGVDRALGPARHVRVAKVLGDALARCRTVPVATASIGAAR